MRGRGLAPRGGAGETLRVPEPLSAEQVRAEWTALSSQPELGCTAAWSSACHAWWHDPGDPRLRARVCDALLLGGDEIASWLRRRLDRPTLLRAHAHVTTMRAGVERDQSHRQLAASALRSHEVYVLHRGGARTVFMDGRRAAVEVERLADTLEALPDNPFVRAAWVVQALSALHAFGDGNGGTSRLLGSLELLRAHLPPLVLTVALRNGAYVDGIAHATHTPELGPLTLAFQAIVQQSLAAALLAAGGARATWDAATRARAERWVAAVDAGWREAVGAPLDGALVRDPLATPGARGAVIARLMRRGYRVPCTPEPLLAHWGCSAQGSTRARGDVAALRVALDLAIAPVVAGGVAWLVAMAGASVGEGGALGSAAHGEAISSFAIAPATEDDAQADLRFGRWLAVRLDQCVRGLSHWM
ncbi:MAG TPA: Fic family protein [Kofleriaceae bacterium]|nr:Fic family protein [Kofleriaceae bacterium]